MYHSLKQEFLNPPAEFSPIPFWFWNNTLSEKEITRQIEDFKKKGIMGFVIHPRKGIPKEIPYLSDKFMYYVKYAVKEAARLHMHVVLYDEAMYPSGSAHGMVVKHHPEYATRALRIVEYSDCTTYTSHAFRHFFHNQLTEGEQLLTIVAARKNEQNLILSHTLQIISEDADKLPEEYSGEDASLFLLIETFSQGTIRGIHFGEDDGEPNAPASADLLSHDAMQEFIRITYDTYYDALKEYFGTTIIAMFTDEPDVLGRNHIPGIQPWTPGFSQYLRAEGIALSMLPLLWFDASDHSQHSFRTAYKKAVNKRLSESYYHQISKWCTAHQISLTGHPAASDDIGLLKYFHIPGQDVVWRWVAPENHLGVTGGDSTMAKCSSDAARHFGKRRNSNECFGCCGPNGIHWAFTADDMKWYLDWLFVRGVNLLYPHAFFYSTEGEERFGERPPDVGPNNTFWPYYDRFSSYIHRMSWLMTDSSNTTPVAVLCKEDYLPWEPAKELFCHQLEFNYLEDTLLQSSCTLDNGWIKIQKQAYRILLLSSEDEVSALAPILKQFTSEGGHIIYWNQESNLAAAITAILLNDASCPLQPMLHSNCKDNGFTEDIRISHVVKTGCDFYLLTNEGEHYFAGTLQIPVIPGARNVTIELWDAWNGTQSAFSLPCNDKLLYLPISLERRESKIISIIPSNAEVSVSHSMPAETTYTEWKTAEDISSCSWKINALDSEFCTETEELTSWTQWSDMENYTGAVSYETSFCYSQDAVGQVQVILDLGKVHEIASLTVNDQLVDTLLWAPYRFDITRMLKKGENSLCITVINTPANHLENAKLPSGLFGPVRLLTK